MSYEKAIHALRAQERHAECNNPDSLSELLQKTREAHGRTTLKGICYWCEKPGLTMQRLNTKFGGDVRQYTCKHCSETTTFY